MKIRIENAYSDGHTSELDVVFDGPAWKEPAVADVGIAYVNGGEPVEGNFWAEVVHDLTGDGHGDGSHGKLGYCHTATIIEADNPELVGRSYEWVGY